MRIAVTGCLTLLGALAACDVRPAPAPSEESLRGVPLAQATVIEQLDLPKTPRALALVPATTPYQSRLLTALSGGGVAIVDLSLGEIVEAPFPDSTSLAIEPGFSLRGASTPLVIAAGAQMAAPQVFLFIPTDGVLVPAPTAPLDPGFAVRAVCLMQGTPGAVNLALVGESDVAAWQVRDAGEEALTAGPRGAEAVIDSKARTCIEQALGAPVEAGLDGFGAVRGSTDLRAALGGENPRDAIALGDPAAPTRIAVLNSGRLAWIEGVSSPRLTDVEVVAGVDGSPSQPPALVAATAQNVGGSYSGGVVVVAADARLSILAYDAVESAVRAASRPEG